MKIDHGVSRRSFFKTAGIAATAFSAAQEGLMSKDSEPLDFPLVDFHVHIENWFPIEKAMQVAQKRGVKFGIVDHPGPGNRIRTDDDLRRHIQKYRQHPVYVGLQPIFLGWSKDFSKDLLDQLDYVLMDPQTIPVDGGYMYIWRADTFVEDVESFMKLYMEHNLRILTTEPVDIFGWATSLPFCLGRYYDKIWTRQRRQTLIDAAKAHRRAIEINEVARVPDENFIRMAKRAGLRFTFGSDARSENAGRFVYCIEMARLCGLRKADMFTVAGRLHT